MLTKKKWFITLSLLLVGLVLLAGCAAPAAEEEEAAPAAEEEEAAPEEEEEAAPAEGACQIEDDDGVIQKKCLAGCGPGVESSPGNDLVGHRLDSIHRVEDGGPHPEVVDSRIHRLEQRRHPGDHGSGHGGAA